MESCPFFATSLRRYLLGSGAMLPAWTW
jgi:hypothetical protein